MEWGNMLMFYGGILRRVLKNYHGFESVPSAQGDGQMLIAFHKPEDAIRFCMKVCTPRHRLSCRRSEGVQRAPAHHGKQVRRRPRGRDSHEGRGSYPLCVVIPTDDAIPKNSVFSIFYHDFFGL